MASKQPTGIEEDEKSLLIDFYVQKVRNRLRQLANPSKKDIKRWVWELSQNAKDSISGSAKNHCVNIEVVIEEEAVTFIHDGSPFRPKTLNRLIWQLSGDKDGVSGESIGRFGTGFLTTHTLSRIVSLDSVLHDKKDNLWGFKLKIDREGDTKSALESGIKRTLNGREYIEDPKDLRTKFKYHLNSSDNILSAVKGVESLKANALFVLAFSNGIKSFTLNNKGVKTIYKRLSKDEVPGNSNLQFVEFSIESDLGVEYKSVLIATSNEISKELTKKYERERKLRVFVGILLDKTNKVILPIDTKTPYLFCDFPLIGTEKFELPFVLNSPDFEPTPERDAIFLAGDEFEKKKKVNEDGEVIEVSEEEQEYVISLSGINRLILKESMNLYNDVLEYLIKNKYNNRYLLAVGAKKMPRQENNFDKKWYKDNIQSTLRSVISRTPLVKTFEGYQPIKNLETGQTVIFPQGKTKEEKLFVYKNTASLYPNRVPVEELFEKWADLVWEEDCSFQTLENLVNDISNAKKIDKLNIIDENKLLWLNEIIKYLSNTENIHLLNDFSIIPNQKKEFRPLNYSNFSKDSGVPDIGITILEMLNVDWKDILLHEEITDCELTHSKGINEVVIEVTQKLKSLDKSTEYDVSNIMFFLTSLFPSQEKVSESFWGTKEILFKISRDVLGEKIPEKQFFDEFPEDLWEFPNKWILKLLLSTIASKKSLTNLELPGIDKLDWLNELVGFVKELGEIELLNLEEYKILPNQNGEFLLKEKLSKDEGIPDELKISLLENFGLILKPKLLHQGIVSHTPESRLHPSTVYLELNKLLKNAIKNNKCILPIVFYLTSLSPEATVPSYTKRKKIWEYSKALYPKSLGNTLSTILNSTEILWAVSDKYLFNKIVKTLEEFKPQDKDNKSSLDLLDEKLNLHGDNVLSWLNKLLEFMSANKFKIGAIVPNQNDNFHFKNDLHIDNKIPYILKNILASLDAEEDYRNSLIHKSITSICPDNSLDTKSISKLIDEKIRAGFKAGNFTDGYKEAVRLLVMDWFENPTYPTRIMKEYNTIKIAQGSLFSWAYERKYMLETEVLSTVEERKVLYMINSKLTKEQRTKIAENPEIITEHDRLKKENETLKEELNKYKGVLLVNETEDVIGISKEVAGIHNLSTEDVKESPDFKEKIAKHEGTSNYFEQTFETLIEDIGIKGEELVWNYLVEKFGNNRVKWVARKDKNDKNIQINAYDFIVYDQNLKYVLYYIDAKATNTSEYQADKIPILLRTGTWDFIKKNQIDNFYLARVFDIFNATKEDIKFLKIKLNKWD